LPPLQLVEAADHGRARPARRVAAIALAGLVPAFALLAPASRWDQPVLLAALVAIALVSLSGMVAIKQATFLDAEFVAVLLAVAFLGPLPAACVWLVAEGAYFLLDRHRLVAHLANVASYGWAVLVGALVLRALGPGRLTAAAEPLAYFDLAAAAIAMLLVNFAITRGIVAVLLDRNSARQILRAELVRPAPATLLMIATGALTAFLYTRVGILALALFATLVVIPQVLLPILLRPRPASELPYQRAVALYALALAQALKLDRARKLVLKDASSFLRKDRIGPGAGQLSSHTPEHCFDVNETVLYYREHWDCPGGIPGAVAGEMIPLASRILAVADLWARLTAAGSPGLTHAQSLRQLESRAGLHFDPSVVAAMAKIVEAEALGLRGDTAYPPRLHRIPLPRLVAKLGGLASQSA
jgi:HD domain-containing protein